jgi:hypothetical protein
MPVYFTLSENKIQYISSVSVHIREVKCREPVLEARRIDGKMV